MNALMAIKIPRLGKPLKTDIALVWLFSSMRAHVFGKSTAIREGLGTNVASIRSFPIMCAHVRSDR